MEIVANVHLFEDYAKPHAEKVPTDVGVSRAQEMDLIAGSLLAVDERADSHQAKWCEPRRRSKVDDGVPKCGRGARALLHTQTIASAAKNDVRQDSPTRLPHARDNVRSLPVP